MKKEILKEKWNYMVLDFIWYIKISWDCSRIYLSSYDKTIYCFSKNGELLWKHMTDVRVKSLDISHDGSLIAYTSFDYVALLNDSGKEVWRSKGLDMKKVDITEDGNLIGAISFDKDITSLRNFPCIEFRLYSNIGNMLYKYNTKNDSVNWYTFINSDCETFPELCILGENQEYEGDFKRSCSVHFIKRPNTFLEKLNKKAILTNKWNLLDLMNKKDLKYSFLGGSGSIAESKDYVGVAYAKYLFLFNRYGDKLMSKYALNFLNSEESDYMPLVFNISFLDNEKIFFVADSYFGVIKIKPDLKVLWKNEGRSYRSDKSYTQEINVSLSNDQKTVRNLRNNVLEIIDSNTGRIINAYKFEDEVTSFNISKDNKSLLVGTTDKAKKTHKISFYEL